VRILVQVPGETGESLYRWLADEPEVRRHGQLRSVPAGTPGEMGDPIAILSLVIGTGLSLGHLLVAIAQWRAMLPRPVRVNVQLPDNRVVTVETDDPEEAMDIARRLEEG
jgi:Effector Associated Constant Component 1